MQIRIFFFREKFQELDKEDRTSHEKSQLKTCKRRLLDDISPAPTSSVLGKKQRLVTTRESPSTSGCRFVHKYIGFNHICIVRLAAHFDVKGTSWWSLQFTH